MWVWPGKSMAWWGAGVLAKPIAVGQICPLCSPHTIGWVYPWGPCLVHPRVW